MTNYNLYKETETVTIPALIEETERSESVTFCKFLNSDYADYGHISIKVPASLLPEVVEAESGKYFTLNNRKYSLLGAEWGGNYGRLPIYRTGGKAYAYIDMRQMRYDQSRGDMVQVGRTIRARFEIVEG